jgi:UDP-glucose 4-epimerase
MSVLVTGGGGYVGSHIVYGLLDAGEDVLVLDDLSTGFRWVVPEEAVFIEGCVGDSDLVRDILLRHPVDAVIHCAGSVVVPESITDPLRYYHNNTCNARSLMASIVEAGVPHFIFSSTAAVYGLPAVNPVGEDAEPRPISPYGTSKLMTELMLEHSATAYGLRYAVLRYFNVAGADPAGRTGQSTANATHLVKVAVEVATGARPYLEIYGSEYATSDGTCVRDYIHVTDLVGAHLAALRNLRDGGGSVTLNCGYGRGASVLEVVEAVERVSNMRLPVKFGPRRPGDPAALVARADRIKTVLGWTPEYDDLNAIVAHALRWERRRAAAERAAYSLRTAS